jgi:hypothetical protein
VRQRNPVSIVGATAMVQQKIPITIVTEDGSLLIIKDSMSLLGTNLRMLTLELMGRRIEVRRSAAASMRKRVRARDADFLWL